MSSEVTVTVPATTANIGPGFDCLGAALNLYNHFHFHTTLKDAPAIAIQIQGIEADRVPNAADNLVYTSFLKLYQHIDQKPPNLSLRIDLGIPLARGLGSSATAIIGGLVGANAIAGFPLTQKEILDIAIALEGHPDNVAPALLGGCQLATQKRDGRCLLTSIPWAENIVPVAAIPEFELSTSSARSVLPNACSYSDAIFNAAHLALLLQGFQSGDPEALSTALSDRLHQPYRKSLITDYDAVETAARDAGAYGMVISGAGPTLLALAPPEQAESVAIAMKTQWEKSDIQVESKVLQIETTGANVMECSRKAAL